MKKLIIIGVLLSVWLWQNDKLPSFSAPHGAYDENGEPVVWVFTFADCGEHCEDALDEMESRGVPFTEYVVDPSRQDSEGYKRWSDMGSARFPFIVAGKSKLIGFNKERVGGLLGETFGDRYLTRSERLYYQKHFDAEGSPQIVMYSVEWCGYCKKMKEDFAASNVDYLEIDVEKSGDKEWMLKTMGIAGYPAVYVGYTRVNSLKVKEITSYL
jgi:glutaredoxin